MPCKFLIGRAADGIIVRLIGRGTIEESFAFHLSVAPSLSAGNVVFDASQCEYLDSTFLGCLVGIKKACERLPGVRFVIVASPQTRDALFSSSSLDRYFDFVDECPDVCGQFAPLDVRTLEADELGRHVMNCHERLAAVGGRGSTAFQAVADHLAQELKDGRGTYS